MDRAPPSMTEAPDASPVDSFKSAGEHFAEFKTFLGNYLAAKADSAKLSLRRLLIVITLAILGAMVGIAVLATAAVLLLVGIAHGIGAIFEPDKPWVGDLIVGVLVLGGAAVGTIVGVRRMTGAGRKRTVAKYESQHAEQRRRFGHDVRDAAAGASAATS